MPRVGTGAGVWRFFEDAILSCLGEMGPFDYLIFEADDPKVRGYVQLIVEANGGVMAECAGPIVAGGPAPWTRQQQQLIMSLGWEVPDLRGGHPNYRLFWLPTDLRTPRPDRVALNEGDKLDIARVVTATIRQVMGVTDPAALVKTAGNTGEGGNPGGEESDYGNSGRNPRGALPGQRWTTSERRLLLEALGTLSENRKSQAWDTIHQDGGGVWGKVRGFTELGEHLLMDSGESSVRESLINTEDPHFSPKERGMLLEALDVFVAQGGVCSQSILDAVRSKLE